MSEKQIEHWCVFGDGYCSECCECALQNEMLEYTEVDYGD